MFLAVMRNLQVWLLTEQKTQVFFSSNVQQSDCDLFTTVLVGQETNSSDRYLGF